MLATSGARRRVRQALALARAGRLADATAQVADAVQNTEVDGAVLIAAAAVRFVARDYQGALDLLDRAMARGGAVLRRAVADRIRFASLLGWDQEVRAGLEAAVAMEPDEARWHALATRAFVRAGATRHALGSARRALELEPTSARMAIEVGRLAAELGHDAEAVAAIEVARRHAPADSLPHALAMGMVLREAGAFDAARARLESAHEIEPSRTETLLELAESALWHGDTHEALRWASRAEAVDPEHGGVARVRGVVALLEGDPSDAAMWLDRALAYDPDDASALHWRAEVAHRMQQGEMAAALLSKATMRAEGFSFVAWVLRFLVVAADEQNPQPLCARRLEEFREAVEEIEPTARAALQRGHQAAVVDCLERTLARMRGNRTPCATFVDDTGILRRVRTRTGVRHASRQALQLIRILPPAEVVAALDEVVARHPDAALPVCHRGELHLWLGDLPRARADLEAAIALDRYTRWAYIGLTGIDILEGDPERALLTCAHGVRTMGNTEGPAVYAYRGEALRLLGRHEEARADLERAIDHTPTRIAAWIDLALVHAATGHDDAFERCWAHLEAAALGLLSDASREQGVRVWGASGFAPAVPDRVCVLEHAIGMLRGNRSTSCATYFTREGRLRFVQPFSQHAKRPHDEDERTIASAEALIGYARRTALSTSAS